MAENIKSPRSPSVGSIQSRQNEIRARQTNNDTRKPVSCNPALCSPTSPRGNDKLPAIPPKPTPPAYMNKKSEFTSLQKVGNQTVIRIFLSNDNDTSFKTVSISDSDSVADVCSIMKKKINEEQFSNSCSLFEVHSSSEQRLLNGNEKIMDIMKCWDAFSSSKLVYKRNTRPLPSSSSPSTTSSSTSSKPAVAPRSAPPTPSRQTTPAPSKDHPVLINLNANKFSKAPNPSFGNTINSEIGKGNPINSNSSNKSSKPELPMKPISSSSSTSSSKPDPPLKSCLNNNNNNKPGVPEKPKKSVSLNFSNVITHSSSPSSPSSPSSLSSSALPPSMTSPRLPPKPIKPNFSTTQKTSFYQHRKYQPINNLRKEEMNQITEIVLFHLEISSKVYSGNFSNLTPQFLKFDPSTPNLISTQRLPDQMLVMKYILNEKRLLSNIPPPFQTTKFQNNPKYYYYENKIKSVSKVPINLPSSSPSSSLSIAKEMKKPELYHPIIDEDEADSIDHSNPANCNISSNLNIQTATTNGYVYISNLPSSSSSSSSTSSNLLNQISALRSGATASISSLSSNSQTQPSSSPPSNISAMNNNYNNNNNSSNSSNNNNNSADDSSLLLSTSPEQIKKLSKNAFSNLKKKFKSKKEKEKEKDKEREKEKEKETDFEDTKTLSPRGISPPPLSPLSSPTLPSVRFGNNAPPPAPPAPPPVRPPVAPRDFSKQLSSREKPAVSPRSVPPPSSSSSNGTPPPRPLPLPRNLSFKSALSVIKQSNSASEKSSSSSPSPSSASQVNHNIPTSQTSIKETPPVISPRNNLNAGNVDQKEAPITSPRNNNPSNNNRPLIKSPQPNNARPTVSQPLNVPNPPPPPSQTEKKTPPTRPPPPQIPSSSQTQSASKVSTQSSAPRNLPNLPTRSSSFNNSNSVINSNKANPNSTNNPNNNNTNLRNIPNINVPPCGNQNNIPNANNRNNNPLETKKSFSSPNITAQISKSAPRPILANNSNAQPPKSTNNQIPMNIQPKNPIQNRPPVAKRDLK